MRTALGGPLPLRVTSRHPEVTQCGQERRPTERMGHQSYTKSPRFRTADQAGVACLAENHRLMWSSAAVLVDVSLGLQDGRTDARSFLLAAVLLITTLCLFRHVDSYFHPFY